jgi:hypothetical protein
MWTELRDLTAVRRNLMATPNGVTRKRMVDPDSTSEHTLKIHLKFFQRVFNIIEVPLSVTPVASQKMGILIS